MDTIKIQTILPPNLFNWSVLPALSSDVIMQS